MKPRPCQPVRPPDAGAPGRVRIIGGRWRGSKLEVAPRPGLRPTSDRVRETLFNWLQPQLPGAHCLDLFAGSGALGFEAASRGTGRVVLIERDGGLAQNLRDSAKRLGGEQIDVVQADALAWLTPPPRERFDIVFIDPPFAAGNHAAACAAVAPWLAPQAWIYVESARESRFATPADWREHRRGETRDVRYVLYHRAHRAADEAATLAPAPDAQTPTTLA